MAIGGNPTATFTLAAEDKTAGAFASVDNKLKSFQQSAQTAAKALNAFGAVAVLRQIDRIADAVLRQVSTFERLNAGIEEVSRRTYSQVDAQQELYDFAQRTGTALETVVQKYVAADRAARAQHKSTTEARQEALRLIEQQAAAQSEVERAQNRFNNSFTKMIGTLSEAAGITDRYERANNTLASTFDTLTGKAGKYASVLEKVVTFVSNIGPLGLAGAGIASLFGGDEPKDGVATAAVAHAETVLEEIKVQARKIDPRILDLKEIRPKDLPGQRAVFDALPEFKDEGAEQRRQQLERQLEQVRQFSLSQEEVEIEATNRRLEILRSAHEQGLLDQKRYYELSADVTQKGNDQLAAISARAAARDRALTGQKIDNIRTLTGAVAAALTAGGENSKKEFEQHKRIAIAAAIIDTAAAAVLALRSGLPPANFIAAAAVAAAGYAQVQQIRSTTWSGGGAGGGIGGGGSGASNPEPSPPPTLPERSPGRDQRSLTVHIINQGGMIGINEDAISEKLYDLLKDFIDRTDRDGF